MTSGRLLALGLVFVVAASAAIAFTRPVGADYGHPDCHLRLKYCDDAQPLIDELAHGHIGALIDKQTLLGPVSVVLRAPFAALGRLSYNDDLELVYDLGSFACLLVLGLAGLLVAAEMRRRGRPLWQQALVAAGILVNPLTFRVLYWGHPEEAVGTGVVIAGALASMRGRAAATGIAAGVTVANKLWGLLAVAPLLLALPRKAWVRGAVAVALTVAVLYGPLAVGNPDRFYHAVTSANDLGTIPGTAGPTNVWWFFMAVAPFNAPEAVVNGKLKFHRVYGFRLEPPLGRLAHPIVIVVALALAFLWARRPRAPGSPDVLLLLALIFLVRCVLDPNNYSYYHLPFLACLGAWEGLARGFPWLAVVSGAYLQFIVTISPHIHSDVGFEWIYLGWALPTVALLAFLTYWRPSRLAPCPSSA